MKTTGCGRGRGALKLAVALASVGIATAAGARDWKTPRVLATKLDFVSALSFSRDGKLLCVAGEQTGSNDFERSGVRNDVSVVQVWRTGDWKLMRSLREARANRAWKVAVGSGLVALTGSPDTSRFARSVWLWEMASGKKRRTFPGADTVRFSPDGRLISVVQGAFDDSWGTRAYDAQLLDARTLRVIRSFDLKQSRGLYFHGFDSSASGSGSGVDWELSPDGRFLAVALKTESRLSHHRITDFGGVLLLDLYRKARPRTLPAPAHRSDLSHGLTFSPDGRQLLIDTQEANPLPKDKRKDGGWRMRFWQTRSGRLQHAWLLPSDETVGAFSPDGTSLLCFKNTADYSHYTMRLREARSGRLRFAFAGKLDDSRSAPQFSPDGALLAGGGYDENDGRTLLWNARTGRFMAKLPGRDTLVVAPVVSPDGTTLAVAESSGNVKIRRLPANVVSLGKQPGGSVAK